MNTQQDGQQQQQQQQNQVNNNQGNNQQQDQPPNPEPEALRNLMVNYIPTNIDGPAFRQIFQQYGPTESARIVFDRETNSSKGYGFVKYRYASSAARAIQNLNGYAVENKRLKVAYSNQAEAQQALMSGFQMGGGGGRGGHHNNNNNGGMMMMPPPPPPPVPGQQQGYIPRQ